MKSRHPLSALVHRAPLRLPWVLVAALACSCTAEGDASLLVDVSPVVQDGLHDVQARATLTDADGDHPRVVLPGVGDDGGDRAFTAVELPAECDGNRCALDLRVPPGKYRATLVLSALDRCGVRGEVFRWGGDLDVDHWQVARKNLEPESAAFDDDGDGVLDVLEAAHCGRFGYVEGAAPPQHCADGSSCCDGVSPLEGQMQSFAGGTTTLPYDKDGIDGADVVDVDAFALDATEVTYGQFARCVLAGVCQAGQRDAPARAAIEQGVDPRLPVQNISPVDAAIYCAYVGKQLPDDAAWDFAAADRDGVRARYPIDVDEGTPIACDPNAAGPAAAHQQAERACPASTLPVGSYASSIVTRGSGAGVADLAGNVAEWTLIRGDNPGGGFVDDNNDGVPDDVRAVVLRGGGVTSVVQFLENDLPLIFDVGQDELELRTAQPTAGFRCAAPVAVVPAVEDACPAGALVHEGEGGGGDDSGIDGTGSDGSGSSTGVDGSGVDGSSDPTP